MFHIKKTPKNAPPNFCPGDFFATVAQQVERDLCKVDVPGSIPGGGSKRE